MRKREIFKIEGDKLTRLRKACPKCGAGVFLAEHKDRLSCGGCGYTEFKGGGNKIPPKPVKEERPKEETGEPTEPAKKEDSKAESTEEPKEETPESAEPETPPDETPNEKDEENKQ